MSQEKKKNLSSITLQKRALLQIKNIWTFINPFLANKGFLDNKDITLIEENKIITIAREFAKTFNEHYINIIKKCRGINPKYTSQCDKNQNIHKTIKEIVKYYENHPSILQTKQNICSSSFQVTKKFCVFLNEIEIKKLIEGLDSKKATGLDTIPSELLKVAVDFLTPLLTKSMNSSIEHNIFLGLAKTGLVVPFYKGKPNKNDIRNFQPVSILNTF